jgi:hypothetical protein
VPEPESRPARPGTVSAASGLLYLLALLSLISAVLAVYRGTFLSQKAVEEIWLRHGATAEQARTQAASQPVSTYLGAALAIVLIALFIVLAVFVNKGKQWARITTWIISGLVVCCGAAGFVLTGLVDSMLGMAEQGGVDAAAILKDTEALVPGWLGTVSLVLSVIQLVAAIAVIVLLLLPPSNPYFRKVEPQWQPPPYPAP